jgi:hypothetical protein
MGWLNGAPVATSFWSRGQAALASIVPALLQTHGAKGGGGMKKAGILTKALATIGALLAWFPIVATIVIAAVGSIAARMVRFDYLMPAELFPFGLAGGVLLLWAALRARSRRALIAWGLGLAVGMLVGGQALAVATGLASGETEPGGWSWVLVLASLAAYALALVELGIAGVLLVGDLFRDGEKGSRPVLPPS